MLAQLKPYEEYESPPNNLSDIYGCRTNTSTSLWHPKSTFRLNFLAFQSIQVLFLRK